jgi:hypothetical protein
MAQVLQLPEAGVRDLGSAEFQPAQVLEHRELLEVPV